MFDKLGMILGMLVSSGLLLFGFGSAIYYWRKIARCTSTAIGVVYQLAETGKDDEGEPEYTVWVRFQFAGRSYEVEDFHSSSHVQHRLGQRVEVYFDPAEPGEALIGRSRILLPFLFMGTLGAGLLAGLIGKWLGLFSLLGE